MNTVRFAFWLRFRGRGFSISHDQYQGQSDGVRIFGITFKWLNKC